MSALRGGLALLSGTGVGFTLRFARNVLIARLISVEDYGIASTFLVAVSFIDMALNLSLAKLAIQHKAGNDPEFISALTGISVLRGLVISAVLLVAASPIAALFGQPDLVWAYQVVAFLPLIGAFGHPDMQRFQRTMRFGPLMLNRLGALGLTLILVWPLALWLGDFRVMLGIYLIEWLGRLAISFVVAERPFRMRWDGQVALMALRFGWPLLLSGLITFAAIQGDRIIIANRFGAEVLGLFSAAMTMTMAPVMTAAEMSRTFFLPLLARHQDDAAKFAHRASFALQSSLCIATLAIMGFALLGPPVFGLVFGPRYAEGIPFVGLLGIVFGLQLAREGMATVALSLGHTSNLLIANIVRLAFLPVALLAAAMGSSALDVIAIGAVGQFCGVVASGALLRYRSRIGGMRQLGLPVLFGSIALAALAWGIRTDPDGTVGVVPAGVALVAFGLMIASCRVMVHELVRIARRSRHPSM